MHETAFLWSDDFLKYSFPDDHPFKAERERITRELLFTMGLVDKIEILEPDPAGEEDLLIVHKKEYVKFVESVSNEGKGFLDQGDTPAFKGIFDASLVRVGATLKALDLVSKGRFRHAMNIGGGLHHAKPSAASGFCVFNDVAIGVKRAEERFNRVAVIDLDGHHADGTQEILYSDPKSFKVSLHMYHRGFFPGSGDVNERGEGPGEGLVLNVPLPPGTADDAYVAAFKEVVLPRLLSFSPQLLFVVIGGDSHYSDPLVELKLSTFGYLEVVKMIHELAHTFADGRLILLGGGGYNYEATARIWILGLAEVLGLSPQVNILHDPEPTRSIPFTYNKVMELIEKMKRLPPLSTPFRAS
ncbi:acetoin utilization protein AcuC [Sulfodiicoccus acidiphilus]|uniref:Acetoin utilization protein AcuC n=1 Tax=Sulfodiicoccus acidiphilus TaxID=1670455 RepID=A0A348B3P7_9CREN|nr:acetoin utilization protein AcuC [Sulfodiicoccus acidiphilus]BBD72799.1 acetoin utilization protein AcuC [Sulfodiicoccus acidiphilus]GGT99899.1 acetoin utilization protein AcuC [Sulfodiicoccus acidiphilus]